jgi:DNA replication and repair protein RecF
VFARAAGEVVRHGSATRLEVVLSDPTRAGTDIPESDPAPPLDAEVGQPAATAVRRRVRINGQHKRPTDLLGHLNVILFSPEDVELIAGPAEIRRRYFNISLCQVDQRYLRTLKRYLRVLQQRNALLRGMRERPAGAGQFEFWDTQLVELGATLMVSWLRALALLNRHLATVYPRLTDESGALRAEYRPNVPLGAAVAELGELAGSGNVAEADQQVRERFEAHLETVRPRERQQGVTLAGPHRDDVGFLAGAVDLRAYGSRGQQRTAALGVKLAEALLMEHYTGEWPVLLLDDVMSELDARRRGFLQSVVLEQHQVILTATDLTPFSDAFLKKAGLFKVEAGRVTPQACA